MCKSDEIQFLKGHCVKSPSCKQQVMAYKENIIIVTTLNKHLSCGEVFFIGLN